MHGPEVAAHALLSEPLFAIERRRLWPTMDLEELFPLSLVELQSLLLRWRGKDDLAPQYDVILTVGWNSRGSSLDGELKGWNSLFESHVFIRRILHKSLSPPRSNRRVPLTCKPVRGQPAGYRCSRRHPCRCATAPAWRRALQLQGSCPARMPSRAVFSIAWASMLPSSPSCEVRTRSR